MKWNWGTGLFAGYTAFALFMLGLVMLAVANDQALVSRQYYRDGQQHQGDIDRVQRAKAQYPDMSLQVAGDSLRVDFGRTGVDKGSIRFIRPADERLDRTLTLTVQGRESMVDVQGMESGLWMVQLEWMAGGEQFGRNEYIHKP